MIGLGLSVVQIAVRQLLGFDPKSLFAASEPGVWYDPSDFSTMFQDAAGTTPVTAVEQPVGRILDKSGRGNHATQTTTTSRPVLSARVNLLTNTEDFANAYWRSFGVVPTISSITEDTSSAIHEILGPDELIRTGQVTTISIEAKAETATHIQLTYTGGANPFANFDLVNGVVSFSGNNPISATISASSDGYFRCTITSSGIGGPGGAGAVAICLVNNNPTAVRRPVYAGTGKSAFIRKVDLRVANTGVGLPAYQRVNTSTDYDTTGFPMYLRFDGVDDWLVTPSINFTSTDKMTVFAGVRKLSDAERGMVAELSIDSWLNNGAFNLSAPRATASYGVFFRGTVNALAEISSGALNAPTTNVLTGLGDISGDQVILRVNGTQAASSTADQGTGNFGNYPLYIGRRNGTELPFNGHLYSLIVRGAQSTAQQIASAEAWVNGKTGAY